MAGGQVAGALGRAGEVDVQAAAGGADVAGGAVEQAGVTQPLEGGEAAAGRAAVVDVEDVGAGCAGGDGQVQSGWRANHSCDLAGSVVASR